MYKQIPKLIIYNETIEPHLVPEHIREIHFKGDYYKKIDDCIFPDYITGIYFGGSFNQILKKDILPKNLKYLSFGKNYQQKIEPGVLPNSLTNLIFEGSYNYPIDEGVLPPSLSHLTIYNEYFVHRIVLSPSVKNIKVRNNFLRTDITKDGIPEEMRDVVERPGTDPKILEMEELTRKLQKIVKMNNICRNFSIDI